MEMLAFVDCVIRGRVGTGRPKVGETTVSSNMARGYRSVLSLSTWLRDIHRCAYRYVGELAFIDHLSIRTCSADSELVGDGVLQQCDVASRR